MPEGLCHNSARSECKPPLAEAASGHPWVSRVENLDEFGPTVLEEIDAFVPSDMSSFNEVDPLAQRAKVIGRPRPVTADEIVVWETSAHQNSSLMLRVGLMIIPCVRGSCRSPR